MATSVWKGHPTFGLVSTHPYHSKPTVVNQWNLSLQRQLGTDWLVTANYVGSETSHLFTGNEMNPAVFLGLGPCTLNGVNYSVCSTTSNTNQRRRLYLQNPAQGQYYGSIGLKDDGGTDRGAGLCRHPRCGGPEPPGLPVVAVERPGGH